MSERISSFESSPSNQSSSSSSNQGAERVDSVEQQYQNIRDRYAELHARLKGLKILDNELQKTISSVTDEMKVIKKEYEEAMQYRALLTGPDQKAQYKATASSITTKLTTLERKLNGIMTDIRRDIDGADLASPVDKAKVREKDQRELLLDGLKSNNNSAGDYNGKTITELEEGLAQLKQRHAALQFASPWMMIIAIHGNNLGERIEAATENYKKLGTKESKTFVINSSSALEAQASRSLKQIALDLFVYHKRIELLERLEKEFHRITSSLKKDQELDFSFLTSTEEVENLSSNLSELILGNLESSGVDFSKNPGAEVFVKFTCQQLAGPNRPRSTEKITNLVTVLLLHAAMKADNSNHLTKSDIKKLRGFFAVDKFNHTVDKLDYDDEMKKYLKDSISTIFKIVNEIHGSALFSGES